MNKKKTALIIFLSFAGIWILLDVFSLYVLTTEGFRIFSCKTIWQLEYRVK